MALRSPRTPAAYREVIQSALQEIERMAVLVEGLLLLARADAGMLRLDLKPMDAAQLLAEVYERTQILAQSRAIVLDLQTLEPHLVFADRERLRRVLLNLVDNAIKYTPAGGRVALSLQQRDGHVCLSVRDTGIGLSEAEQEHVFQRFHRADSARDHGVPGLAWACASPAPSWRRTAARFRLSAAAAKAAPSRCACRRRSDEKFLIILSLTS